MKELFKKLLGIKETPKEKRAVISFEIAKAIEYRQIANQVIEYYDLLIKENLDKFNDESQCIDLCTTLMNNAETIVRCKHVKFNEMLYTSKANERPNPNVSITMI